MGSYSHVKKGKSLWEATPKVNYSWLWKKLLWVRDKFPFLFAKEIGNGQCTLFWHDPWHPWGILSTSHPELKRKLGISDDVRVSCILENITWNIPYGRGWDNQVTLFNQACSTISVKQGERHLDIKTKFPLLHEKCHEGTSKSSTWCGLEKHCLM